MDTTSAIESVFERSRGLLRVRASRIVGADSADDVVQQAFVKALEHHLKFRGDSSLAAWVTSIVVNEGIDELRRRRRMDQVDVGDTWRERCAKHSHFEHVAVKKAFASLPRHHRRILVLVDVLGYTYDEASIRIGTRVGTIKSRVLRARRRLADVFAAGVAKRANR